MAASEYLSDPDMGLKRAMVMGAATSVAIATPGLPWLIARGTTAITLSLLLAMLCASVIAYERRGGWRGWVQTWGVLAVVSVIATEAGHLGA